MGKTKLIFGFLAVLEGCNGCEEKSEAPLLSEHVKKTIEVPLEIRACIEEAREAIGKFGKNGDHLLQCAQDIAQTANALAREHRNEPFLTDQIAALFRQGMSIALQASTSTSTAEKGRLARELSYEMQGKLLQQEAAGAPRRELPAVFSQPPPKPPSPPEPPQLHLSADVVRCHEYKGTDPRVLWGCARKIGHAAEAYERWFREHMRDEYEYWNMNSHILKELDDLYSFATFQAYDGGSAEYAELEASPAYPHVRPTVVPSPALEQFVNRTFDDKREAVSSEKLRTMAASHAWFLCEDMHDFPDYKGDAAFQFDCAQRMKVEAEKKQKRLTAKSTQFEISEAARLHHRAGTFAITAAELEKDPAKSSAMARFATDVAAEWMNLQERLDLNP